MSLCSGICLGEEGVGGWSLEDERGRVVNGAWEEDVCQLLLLAYYYEGG
jgi:hypothetical protein